MEGPVELDSDTFHVVLCSSSQALSASFAGPSTNCQYSDLTDELTTADGYTVGGVVLSSSGLSFSSPSVIFSGGTVSWTLTGSGITFKYAVIVDWTSPNKDCVLFCDMDTTGGTVSPTAGTMQIQPSPGGIETFT